MDIIDADYEFYYCTSEFTLFSDTDHGTKTMEITLDDFCLRKRNELLDCDNDENIYTNAKKKNEIAIYNSY